MNNYSQHLFKILLVLLFISAFFMFALAYRTAEQEQQFHLKSLSRSANSTAREIELYIGSLQRALRVFAMQEQDLLINAVSNPSVSPEVEKIIALHFPELLAFAISDTYANSPIVSEPDLFGMHCRSNLSLYANNDATLNTELSLHSAGSDGTEHFDLIANIQSEEHTGILFISIEVDVLQRLMRVGSSDTYSLALHETDASIGTHDTVTLLSDNILDMKNIAVQQHQADYRVAVTNTPWILQGILDTTKTNQARNTSILQSIIGSVVLLFAGFAAWRSIEQEKISRHRTAIILGNVEAERKRIARDLHDQVLSDVSHAKRLLMDLGPEPDDDNSRKADILRSAQKSVEDFSTSIRSAIDDLYPHTLENLGLFHALESFAQQRCQFGQSLSFHSSDDIERLLSTEHKLHVFRIVSELIGNSLAHSGCTTMLLNMEQNMNTVVVRFEDNGTGFDYDAVATHGRHGLTNIESRTATLGATGTWDLSNGTHFELKVPIVISNVAN